MAESEKSEKATPRKREDERKKGNIFQSRDVASAFGLLGLLLFWRAMGPLGYAYLTKMVRAALSSFAAVGQFTSQTAMGSLSGLVINAAVLALPLAGAAIGLGLVAGGAQTRLLVSGELLKPKFSRLNPIAGLRKMFALRSLVEILKSLFKIIVVALILYTEIKADMSGMIRLMSQQNAQAFGWICETAYRIALKIAFTMAGFAVLDYLYQWWEHEKQLRMTKQEVKDEYKKTEGDPQIRSRIRELQRKMAHTRMMQQVPKADVVIRNPTHYAVALRYEAQKDRAPRVVAKGTDLMALKIVEIAQQNDVYVTENRPLARGLYQAAQLDREIPEQYYLAVANVLAFVYNLKKKGRGA